MQELVVGTLLEQEIVAQHLFSEFSLPNGDHGLPPNPHSIDLLITINLGVANGRICEIYIIINEVGFEV